MSLSKENYDKLNENYLYKKEPAKREQYTYHCKNWTFKVHKYENGDVHMFDTYFDSWDSHTIQVTDENIDEFEVVFDFREVKRISDSEVDEYKEEDLYCAATSSGGYSCGKLHWIKKDAVKSKDLLINKKKEKIESLKRQLEWAEGDLERLLSN